MFRSDYRYFGEHAKMTDELLIENGGIFHTVYDAYFSAAVIGYLSGGTSREKGDRKDNKTIFSDKFSNEIDKTNLIVRTLLLANNSLDNIEGEPGRVDRSLRNYNDTEIGKLNRKYIESYAFKGLEILHEEFIRNKGNTDIVTYAKEIFDKYADSNTTYENIQNMILDLAKTI